MTQDKMTKMELLKSLLLAIRRKYLLWFRKKYVRESIAKRKGQCNQCPCCFMSKIFLSNKRCKHLDENKCGLYHTGKMPYGCKIYPIDEKDKIPFAKRNCGYYWEEEK